MEIYGSFFMDNGEDVDVHPDNRARPVLKVGTLAIHLPDEAKLVELQDHIAAYLSRNDSELDPAAGACAAVGQAISEEHRHLYPWSGTICLLCGLPR